MQVNVSQLLKAPIGSIRSCEVGGIIEITESKSLVQGEVELMRTDRGILVKGNLHTEVEVTCGRCLGLFSYPLTLNIEEEFFPTTDVISGASLPSPEEPGCFTIDEHHVLDLTEAVRQYALLALPMKLICRQGCAGLCPSCGRNLNEGPCDCPPQTADLRWSELKKLTLASDAVINERKGIE